MLNSEVQPLGEVLAGTTSRPTETVQDTGPLGLGRSTRLVSDRGATDMARCAVMRSGLSCLRDKQPSGDETTCDETLHFVHLLSLQLELVLLVQRSAELPERLGPRTRC